MTNKLINRAPYSLSSLLCLAAILFSLVGVARGQSAHSVTLTFPAGVGGGAVTSFGILRATTSGGEPVVPTSNTAPCTVCIGSVPFVAGQTTYSFVDNGTPPNTLVEGTTYFYVEVAIGPGGTSAPSPESSATIPFSPPASPGKATLVVK